MKNLFIKPNSSIKNAFKQFTQEGEKCLVVVDNKNKLLGTLSDGDIRKAVLRGKFTKDKISGFYNKNPTFVREENYTIEQIKNIFEKKRIDVIPVVSANKTVNNILTSENIFKKKKIKKHKKNISTTVVIMAGGKGTRMEPFTNVLPKPLVPINEKPVIEHIIEKFTLFGAKNFYLTVNYKSRILKSFFLELKPNYSVKFFDETKPLGTVGGLKSHQKKFKNSFFVTNCDVIVDADYKDILNFHKINDYDITLVASATKYFIPYGICELDNAGHLKGIKEKPSYNFLANTGLYILNPKVLKLIPKNEFFQMTELIKKANKKRLKIGVYPIDSQKWVDVGHWTEYKKTLEKM